MSIEIKNAKQLEEVLSENKNVVVDFYAVWCGPCQRLGQIVHSIEGEYENVVFAKVNVDEVPELASKYGVFSIPQVNLFKENKQVDMFVGARDVNSLKEILNKNF